MIFEIMDNAKQHIKVMMADETDSARLRFGVKCGGCSGLSYSLGFDYDINADLDTVDVINDIPVVIFK